MIYVVDFGNLNDLLPAGLLQDPDCNSLQRLLQAARMYFTHVTGIWAGNKGPGH